MRAASSRETFGCAPRRARWPTSARKRSRSALVLMRAWGDKGKVMNSSSISGGRVLLALFTARMSDKHCTPARIQRPPKDKGKSENQE